MIRLRTSSSYPLVIDIEIRSPIIYLDYCVIGDLIIHKEIGDRFRQIILQKGGTLYFSWAHILELFGLGLGPTYEKIKNYLSSFGNHFLIIDCDPNAVISRENEWRPGKQNSALEIDILKELIFDWDGFSELDFAVLLKALESDASIPNRLKNMQLSVKESVHRIFQDARLTYRIDRIAKKNLGEKTHSYVKGTPPTRYVLRKLLYECIKTGEDFTLTDSLDFYHCIVATSYAEYIVLDNKWADRLKK